jgi:hypothetical protein
MGRGAGSEVVGFVGSVVAVVVTGTKAYVTPLITMLFGAGVVVEFDVVVFVFDVGALSMLVMVAR